MSIPDDELKKLREKYGPSYGWTSGAAEDRAEVVAIIDEALSRGADVRGLGGTIEGLQHHLSAVLAERDEARAALAKAEQERDALKAPVLLVGQSNAGKDYAGRVQQAVDETVTTIGRWVPDGQVQRNAMSVVRELRSALANARAVAFEDCRKAIAAGWLGSAADLATLLGKLKGAS